MPNQEKDASLEKKEPWPGIEGGSNGPEVTKEELKPKGSDKKKKKETAPLLKQLIDQKAVTVEKILPQESKKKTVARAIKKASRQDSLKTANYAANVAALSDAESQVEKLIELAEQIGPLKAIEVARHLDDNYVMDKLHDGLLEDRIRAILEEKGLLE